MNMLVRPRKTTAVGHLRGLLAELYRRDRVLSLFGWFFLGLFLVTLAGSAFDGRIILGINPWFKPMKFMSATAVLLWTLAWFVAYVPGSRTALRVISSGTSLSMSGVVACVSVQSLRGTTSSFNMTSPFNTFVYVMLGVTILIASLLVVYLLVLFFERKVELTPAYLWGIRLGILVFLVGSFQGGLMSLFNAHCVGRPDGGSGLPLTNWSTDAGDLRVAHMAGVHSLQIIPLAGFLLGRRLGQKRPALQVAGVALFTLLYTAGFLGLLIQALVGQPLLAL